MMPYQTVEEMERKITDLQQQMVEQAKAFLSMQETSEKHHNLELEAANQDAERLAEAGSEMLLEGAPQSAFADWGEALRQHQERVGGKQE